MRGFSSPVSCILMDYSMSKRNIILFLVPCLVIIWLLNCFMLAGMLAGHGLKNISNKKNDSFSLESAQTDSALKIHTNIKNFEYKGNFISPFKSTGEAFPVGQRKKAPKDSVKLTLQGVLLKNQPLAIILDDSGHTFICGINESIKGQRIEKISSDGVVLHNNSGSYTLTVKE